MEKDFSNSRRDFLELSVSGTAGLFLKAGMTKKPANAESSQATAKTINDNPTLQGQFMRALAQVWPQPQSLSVHNSYLLGPFENSDDIGWATAYPPETDPGAAIDTGKTYQGKNGNVHWRRQESLDGILGEPVKVVEPAEAVPNSVTYCAAEVQASAPTAALFRVQCSGLVKVWVNGALVNSAAVYEQANADGATGWIALKGGANRILVKMAFGRSSDQRLAVQVKSYDALDQAVQALRALAKGPSDPGIRLTAKVLQVELLGTALDKSGTQQALAAIREDPYATRWDLAWCDAVDRQYRSTGQFAPFHDAGVIYEPVDTVKPYPEFWPQSQPTAKELLVVDVSEYAPEVEFSLSVLQGLVNRSTPRLYLLHTRYSRQDRMWLDELHLEGYTSREISVDEAWSQFKGEIKGAVIYDGSIMEEIGAYRSNQLNQTNVLMMIGALEDAVPLTPEMNQSLGLPVVFDARGRWTSQYDMMHWAYLQLFPRMNQRLLATNYPGIFLITDYLVSFKVFTFWFPEYRTTIEENLLRGILASTPPNSPILGWWFDWMPSIKDPHHRDADAVMEDPGVLRGSFFGKFLTASHEATNLTVHSGVPLLPLKHKTPYRPAYDPSKIYYTFMISDGDNLGEALMMRTRDLQWDKPERGAVPMGWSFAPATSRLAPTVQNYYLRTATPNDVLMGGLGAGYTEPELYLRAFPKQFEQLWSEYARDTDESLGWIDSTVLWLINGRHEEADRYARGSSGQLRGIFIGYGGSPDIAEARVTYNKVVEFYPATGFHEGPATPEKRIQTMVDEIRAAVRRKQTFIEAWVLNWGLDLSTLIEVQKRLGPDFVCVRPDVLVEMRLMAS